MNSKTQNIIFISSLTGIALASYFLLRKRGRLYFSSIIQDLKLWNEEQIKTLHPKVRDNARRFIQLAENEGIKLRISEGLRSQEDQTKYYLSGTSKVTFGLHMVGLAIDVYPVKEYSYNSDLNYYPDFDKIKELGVKAGFTRVGDWDKPHYEMKFGNEYSDLKIKYNNEEIGNDGYLKL